MAALLKKRALAEYGQTLQEPQTKKLNLVKKPLIGSSAAAFVGLLEKCKTSNDALQLLLRVSDSLQFQETDLEEAVKKLGEHYQHEEESAVRVKILGLFCDIGLECHGADVSAIVDNTIALLKTESSHKVIAQGIMTLLKLGGRLSDSQQNIQLIELTKEYLKDTSHQVKCRCLQLISELFPVQLETEEHHREVEEILKLLGDYTHSQDARVRCEAFQSMLTLHNRGMNLDPRLYDQVCLALSDDYESVRQVALNLIACMANKYPENTITLADGETTLRFVDDAFVRICGAVSDLSMSTRALACSLLGNMHRVSQKFLQQTLDKKLMSNMRRKQTAHERGAKLVSSGEWSDGRRWGQDTPCERLPQQQAATCLMAGGAAGAFVHGLEDEFLEVRSAAVESVCQLALNNPTFATTSLDFLVDMFNDEIEDVRLKAIDSLTRISRHIVLREDQLETILGALEDFSMDVREGLHRMLASSTLASKVCLEMCVTKILDNLKKYPQDRKSTFRCLQRIGSAHPELTLPLVPQVLSIHPFFDMPQPDVEDPAYICILILVLNAAQHCSAMLQLFEEHTIKHYSYLRDTMPHLVPPLPIGDTLTSAATGATTDLLTDHSGKDPSHIAANTRNLLDTIMTNVENAGVSAKIRATVLASAQKQLNRLAKIEPSVSGTANFMALYMGSELIMSSILSSRLWSNPTALASPQGLIIKNNIATLVNNCLKLQHLFVGCNNEDLSAVKQLTLRALALQLVYIVRGSNQSALAPCHSLMQEIEDLDKFLSEYGLEPDPFTIGVFQQISLLNEPKPGPVARCLLPLLQSVPPSQIPTPNTNIKMCSACILDPTGESETAIKFTAGLVAAIPLEAEILHVRDPLAIRVRVKYPDQHARMAVPRAGDLRKLDHHSDKSEEGTNLRLLTKVLVSHQVWTDSCPIEINLCLAVPDQAGSGKKEASLIDLCKPVKVNIAPKPIKRGI